MTLHDDAAYLALQTHDARFDGRFFVGVTHCLGGRTERLEFVASAAKMGVRGHSLINQMATYFY